jgi:hypothetical protein
VPQLGQAATCPRVQPETVPGASGRVGRPDSLQHLKEGWAARVDARTARTDGPHEATRRIRLGLLVSCNTFREPALVAKMATTLDHITEGGAILGIGAGWFEAEHTAYGIPFGSSARERLSWLAEALPIIRGMLDDGEASAVGPRYRVRQALNSPRPVQGRLPVLVGGDGEKVTLRLVAKQPTRAT